jgi:hypothetical protein
MELKTVRTIRDARRLILSYFDRLDSDTAGIVRSTAEAHGLNQRDVLRYLERQLESDDQNWAVRIWSKCVLGGMFGWGVRVYQPVRTYLIAMPATAAVVLLIPGNGISQQDNSIERIGKSVTIAAALWLNVDIGAMSDLRGHVWTAAAIFFGIIGLAFYALLIGIFIRKLVGSVNTRGRDNQQ